MSAQFVSRLFPGSERLPLVEEKLRSLSIRQTILIVLWLAVACIASFAVAMLLSGSVLAIVD